MAIKELVDQIIERRHSRLPAVEKKVEELQVMLRLMDEFEAFKMEVIDEDGNAIEGKFKYFVDKNPEMAIKLNVLSTDECRRKIEAALVECEKVYRRFSRESINIAVVGKARIGKSRLLQSISNLSGKVIPDSSDSDCTGAVSVIENKPGIDIEAHLKFKTEEQIIKAVQNYIDKILSEDDRIVIRSLNQIRDLDIDAIREKVAFGSPEAIKIPYLEKFVFGFNDWAPLVKEKEIVLTDENEIQQYVAQHNGADKGEEKIYFYKYLAVESCNIYCTYDYEDAGKITLVDTVGLDDNAEGLIEDVLSVIRDKSDAVVFLLFPLSLAGGGIAKDITAIYTKIKETCQGKNLDKWLSWLINHAPKHPTTPNPYEYCESTMDTLVNKAKWYGEVKKIVDISDQNQVREEFLIPLLNTLTANLDEIDDLYLEDMRGALAAVTKEYGSFCASAKKLMNSEIGNMASMQPQMAMEIDKIFKKMTAQLKALAASEKEKREVPCNVLKDRVDGIIASMKDGSMVPSVNDVKEELKSEQPTALYMQYCNRLRSEITQRFTDVDTTLTELVEKVKNDITEILFSDEGCRLGRVLNGSAGKQTYEWLKSFAEMMLDDQAYSNLYQAFMNVYSFEFSVRGFLTYEVRACLDGLDPDLKSPPGVVGDTDAESAENISFWLERKLLDVSEALENKLGELFRKPHRAFFAVIKEFSDKVVYADGVRYEWNRLYSGNYNIIWAEDYKNMAIAEVAFKEWDELLKKLLEYNSRLNTFEI